jgi:nucleoside-diphosphate-sugar epimerase
VRVLFAGATGVIGRQAVPALAAAGHQVTGLAGAANTRSRAELDWKPACGNWRDGLAADLAVRPSR